MKAAQLQRIRQRMIIADQKIKCKKITGKAFRLIFDDKQIIALIDGTSKSKTWTKHNAEEFTMNQQALARIDKLGLEYVDQENLKIKE